jgi:hypothetical protein
MALPLSDAASWITGTVIPIDGGVLALEPYRLADGARRMTGTRADIKLGALEALEVAGSRGPRGSSSAGGGW